MARRVKRLRRCKSFETEDGYRFYVLPDGSVADSEDPDAVDMSWPSVADFLDSVDVRVKCDE